MIAGDNLWEGIRQLTWHQHEGSGTTLTLSDVLSLPYRRFVEWIEWVEDRRQKEAAAINKARKR